MYTPRDSHAHERTPHVLQPLLCEMANWRLHAFSARRMSHMTASHVASYNILHKSYRNCTFKALTACNTSNQMKAENKITRFDVSETQLQLILLSTKLVQVHLIGVMSLTSYAQCIAVMLDLHQRYTNVRVHIIFVCVSCYCSSITREILKPSRANGTYISNSA